MTTTISAVDLRTSSAQAQALSDAQSAKTIRTTAKTTAATQSSSSSSAGATVQISVAAQVKQLGNQGKTAEQIARKLNLTLAQVQKYLGSATTSSSGGSVAQTLQSARALNLPTPERAQARTQKSGNSGQAVFITPPDAARRRGTAGGGRPGAGPDRDPALSARARERGAGGFARGRVRGAAVLEMTKSEG